MAEPQIQATTYPYKAVTGCTEQLDSDIGLVFNEKHIWPHMGQHSRIFEYTARASAKSQECYTVPE